MYILETLELKYSELKDFTDTNYKIAVAEKLLLEGSVDSRQIAEEIFEGVIMLFGAFLIIEVWISAKEETDSELSTFKPVFKIIRSKKTDISPPI